MTYSEFTKLDKEVLKIKTKEELTVFANKHNLIVGKYKGTLTLELPSTDPVYSNAMMITKIDSGEGKTSPIFN
jgi:hypothetical protein